MVRSDESMIFRDNSIIYPDNPSIRLKKSPIYPVDLMVFLENQMSCLEKSAVFPNNPPNTRDKSIIRRVESTARQFQFVTFLIGFYFGLLVFACF